MNRRTGVFSVMIVAVALMVAPATAAIVDVTVEGQVGFNGISGPPLGSVGSGDNVVMSFQVDSDNFVDGVPGDTRGYVIDQASFSMEFDTPVSIGLLDPFPGGQTPYFTLVDGFPVSDGFFVSTSPFSPGGVPLAQEPVNANLSLGYVGDTLSSLDILDAEGVYEFDGLTSFGFNLWQSFPDNVVMDMEFQRMTITPEPTTFAMIGMVGLVLLRRRR